MAHSGTAHRRVAPDRGEYAVAWFGRDRRGNDDASPPPAVEDPLADAFEGIEDDDGRTLRPQVAEVTPTEASRIAAAVGELEAAGVDIDDPRSLGAAYDRAYREWEGAPEDSRPDHAVIVDRFALGIGEHLNRHTDLDWQIVTDVFGTDLAVAGGFSGSFSVVPGNLVAARWMRGETGWVPGVVAHLVAIRTRRP